MHLVIRIYWYLIRTHCCLLLPTSTTCQVRRDRMTLSGDTSMVVWDYTHLGSDLYDLYCITSLRVRNIVGTNTLLESVIATHTPGTLLDYSIFRHRFDVVPETPTWASEVLLYLIWSQPIHYNYTQLFRLLGWVYLDDPIFWSSITGLIDRFWKRFLRAKSRIVNDGDI
jgi:hypothetical protein